MKIAVKFAIFAVALCILVAAVWVGYYLIYEGGSSGHFAFAVELRMLALDAADLAPGHEGPIYFKDADARKFIDTGEAPDGWKWVPAADFAPKVYPGFYSSSGPQISRTSNGQVFLLVANSADLSVILTDPESVKLDTSKAGTPILKIRIDSGDVDVLSKFREVHSDNEVAIVIEGQICGLTGTSDLDRVIEIWFPDGGEDAAKHLRDTLLSKKY